MTFYVLTFYTGLFTIGQAQTIIEFWHSQNTTEALIQTFADEFNALQAEYRVVPSMTGNYQESAIKLVAALGSNSAPTLFDAELTVFAKLHDEGSLANLSTLTDTLPDDLTADIFPVLWSYGQFDDGRYGLPWNNSMPVLYYNKSVLDQRGVTPPATWGDFETAAEALTTRNTRGYIDVAGSFIFEAMVTTWGGSILTQDGQPNFASPEAVDALTMLQRMAQAKTSIPHGLNELDQALVDFARAKGMMAIASEAFFPQGERFSVAFDVAAAPVPVGPSPALPLVGAQLVIPKGTSEAEQQGAVAFWQFLLQPENVKRWVEASYFLPVRQSAVELLDPWYAEDPSRKTGLNQLANAVMRPRTGEYAVWQSYLAEAIERATKTGADPTTVLQEAQQRALEAQ